MKRHKPNPVILAKNLTPAGREHLLTINELHLETMQTVAMKRSMTLAAYIEMRARQGERIK